LLLPASSSSKTVHFTQTLIISYTESDTILTFHVGDADSILVKETYEELKAVLQV